MERPKSVAVIGAGVSGLAAAKTFKDAGLNPRIFEASAHVGGIWSPESRHIYQSMPTNVSKYACSFSDFPWDMDAETAEAPAPMFPPAHQVGKYLANYAQKFLKDSISFCSFVTYASFNRQKKKWDIKVESAVKVEGKKIVKHHEFDFLVPASGFFSKPFIPYDRIPSIRNFKGETYHSSQAHINLSQGKLNLAGKRVAVIGGSLSGVEVVSSLASVENSPSKIFHITKNPFWVLPRFLPVDPSSKSPCFLPIDLVKFPDVSSTLSPHELASQSTATTSRRIRNMSFRKMAGHQPSVSPLLEVKDDDPGFLAISDTYAEYVRNSDVDLILGEVYNVRDSALDLRHEEDGEVKEFELEGLDVIVWATGFSTSLPYFDDATLKSIEFDDTDLFQPLLLFSKVLHPSLPQAAFVGMYRGPYFPVIELQARFVAALFSGSLNWPSKQVQWEGISVEKQIRLEKPRRQFPSTSMQDLESLEKQMPVFKRTGAKHPIAANYSESPAATSILTALEADLQLSGEGKWVAEAVFRNLQGAWKFERHCEEGTQKLISIGTATFTRKRRPLDETEDVLEYLYSEESTVQTTAHTENHVYHYRRSEDTLRVAYDLDHENDFSSFSFTRDIDVGWIGNVAGSNEKTLCRYIFPFEALYISTFNVQRSFKAGESKRNSEHVIYTRN